MNALTAPLRYRWALALAGRANTRTEGIRRLRHGFDADILYLGAARRALRTLDGAEAR